MLWIQYDESSASAGPQMVKTTILFVLIIGEIKDEREREGVLLCIDDSGGQ